MNIKKVTFGLLAVTILSLQASAAQDVTRRQILKEANQRIQRYRTEQAILKLVDAEGNPIKEGTSVRVQQTRHQFLFGCNLYMFDKCASEHENVLYEKRFSELFNFATLGFYWNSYEAKPDRTLAAERFKAAKWCQENNIAAKGHPLVWTYEPEWLKKRSAGDAENRLWLRIRREVEEFDGLIDIWDVLNEPCVGVRQGNQRKAETVVRLYEKMKTTHLIQKSFMVAENANPRAGLILNDYDTSEKYEKVIESCLTRGISVKIDAIGIQSHMHDKVWAPEKTWDVCQRFGRFNKPLHFTEVTIVSGPGQWENWGKTNPFLENRQAEKAVLFYTMLFSHPAVEAITWWDLSDQGAWQNAPAGLIRDDMSPKPAYEALKKLIKEDWWTDQTRTVGPNGRLRFTGFMGNYLLSVGGQNNTYKLTKNPKQQTLILR
ncbi:MAG: endo-1,4-beta-xylanase [Planctomycetota bacterium]|jgi:GH35 family endo-1,4-beta-xylanase